MVGEVRFQLAGREMHALTSYRIFPDTAAGMTFKLKIQTLTIYKEFHSHGSQSEIWVRRQANIITHSLYSWHVQLDLSKDARQFMHSHPLRNSPPW
jgi:hypothetical protein